MPWLWPLSWIHPSFAMPKTSRMAAQSANTEVNNTAIGSSSER